MSSFISSVKAAVKSAKSITPSSASLSSALKSLKPSSIKKTIKSSVYSAKESFKQFFSPMLPEEGLPIDDTFFNEIPENVDDPIEERSPIVFKRKPKKCETLFRRLPSLDSTTGDMDSYLKRYINQNSLYTKYYNWLKYNNFIAYNAILEYQNDSNIFYAMDKENFFNPLSNLYQR